MDQSTSVLYKMSFDSLLCLYHVTCILDKVHIILDMDSLVLEFSALGPNWHLPVFQSIGALSVKGN